ncbi:MAG TPA: hypothetical protein IAA58_00460 [Candidatus Gallacutalibacter stercoravium]|nr:hypothetical protein [Candidatus Gallacutalibacter stercoravium]
MKATKKLTALLLAASCLLAPGCFPDGSSAPTTAATNSEALTAISSPSRLQQDLGENLTVDADIDVPETLDFHRYAAREMNIDFDTFTQAAKLIYPADAHITFVEDTASEDRTHYQADTGNEDWFAYFHTSESDYCSFSLPRFSSQYYSLVTSSYGETVRQDMRRVFPNNRLDGWDPQEAIRLVKEKLDVLGVPIASTPEVFALDVDSLQKEWVANWKIAGDKLSEEYGEEPVTWTKEDEAYVIYYRLVAPDGHPINRCTYIPGNEEQLGAITSCAARGTVDKEGLLELSVNGMLEVTEELGPQEIKVDLDQVLEQIQQKYEAMITTNPVVVTRIGLEYLPQLTDAQQRTYELIPVWVVETHERKYTGGGEAETSLVPLPPVLIDAATGQEIMVAG